MSCSVLCIARTRFSPADCCQRTLIAARRPSTKSAARNATADTAEPDGPPLLILPSKGRGSGTEPPTPGKSLPQASSIADSASLVKTLGRTTTALSPGFLKQTLGRTVPSMEPDFFRQTLGRTPTGARTDLMRQTLGRADTNMFPDFLRQTLGRTTTNMGSGFFGRTLGRAATGKQPQRPANRILDHVWPYKHVHMATWSCCMCSRTDQVR